MLFTIVLLISIIYGKKMHKNPSHRQAIRRLWTSNIGELCSIPAECYGSGTGPHDTLCCGGICLPKQTKEGGEKCSCHEECDGYGLGTYDMACCDGYCTQKVEDWAGVGYCPNECVGRAAASQGTCPLKEEGESCNVHEDCKEMGSGTYDMACCDGYCTKKVKDWAGVGYCPSECKGHEAASGGTCPLKEIGESCKLHEDCKGVGLGTYAVACCKGTCQRKQKDFAGVGYCPHECRGGWNCGAGTCPSGRSSGSSCNCSGMCSSGCCEGGKCVDKKKDYVKTYWCPAECKKCLWCKHGSC